MTQCGLRVCLGNSLIQHGHFNNRIYVIKLDPDDIPDIIRFADDLSHKEGYSKIFARVPESSVELFSGAGYKTEATVPFFFRGKDTAVFMAKYPDPGRKEVPHAPVLADILSAASGYAGERSPHEQLPEGFSMVQAHTGDAREIAALYRSVFKTHPYPGFDPDYIRESMQGQVRYFMIPTSRQLAAVASCEIDPENRNVEMTDFATDPLFRGRGFAGMLLHAMETDIKNEGVLLAHTIARAFFKPINAVFAGAGYHFGGLLPNDINICGTLESMKVWYKKV
jgi:putative beta-lysine N-acetyltransferase